MQCVIRGLTGMNNKRIIFNAFIIILALALFIIFYEFKIKDKAITVTFSSNYKVTLITMDKVSHYWDLVNKGASDMANMLGITYSWDAPMERNVNEQIEIIRNAINAGADAMLIAASDPVKVSGVIEDAKAVGIKIIYVDAPAFEEGIVTLATDNYDAGLTAGRTMIDELEAVGIRSGSIGIVGVTRENITTMARERGFRDAIKAHGNYALLDTKYTEGNEALQREAPVSFIADNADLVGLFGTNENTTEGVGNAIKESNRKIIGIGFDTNAAIDQMIKDGYIQAVMLQNPYTMGYLGMAEALAALKGFDTGPTNINTGVSVKTIFTN
jgi:ribose transport system substrate-binding protein